MGVSLGYRTEKEVPEDIKLAISREAELVNNREWWAEAIAFYEPDGTENRLFGDTKLFLISYSGPDDHLIEVDPEEDSFMACRDAQFIVDTLARWSDRFNLTWIIECMGDDVGKISKGKIDSPVTKFVRGFAHICKSDPYGSDSEIIAKHLCEKYRSRWED